MLASVFPWVRLSVFNTRYVDIKRDAVFRIPFTHIENLSLESPLFFAERSTEFERVRFAGLDDDETAMVVQCVRFCGHRLDGDAFASGRRVDLDGVVLLVTGNLPDVEGLRAAFEEYVCRFGL